MMFAISFTIGCALGGAIGTFLYQTGKRRGRAEEKDRCMRICEAVWYKENRSSPTTRRVYHAIANNLVKVLSEEEFFSKVEWP